jgi:hypothetical protein
MPAAIPVICDRCRAAGEAGAEGFADFGDLLDFEPVPRRPRADGWTAELQRAFIAALAVTGSVRRAARAVGKAAFGAEQLRKAKGAEGFNAAWHKAMALAAEKGRHRLAAGLGALAREAAANSPPAPASPADSAPDEEQVKLDLLGVIVRNYLLKVEGERRARLAGRIPEADFYLRQLTMLEVALDVTSGDGMKILKDARRAGHDLLSIAETEMSRLLGRVRRRHWQAEGEPPRPEYPPRHLLMEQSGVATEPLPATWGGLAESHDEQRAKFEAQHARDAEAQIAWEAEARRDFEDRRVAARPQSRETGPAGQPAP